MRTKSSYFDGAPFESHLRKWLMLGITVATVTFSVVGCASYNKHATAGTSANVSGTWQVTIPKENSPITGFASLEQSGNAVTGGVGPSLDDPIPITGSVTGNQFIFQTFPQPGRTT